jgi:prepilin-type N-terminal cleavage/methylation domain-containing protein
MSARGFTLIELIVVLGIFSILAAAGLAFSFDSYRGYLFQSEYTSTVNLLAKARNRAINNFNESDHAIEVLSGEYRLYATDEYSASDPSTYLSLPRNNELTFTGPTKVVFAQLSGDLASCDSKDPCEITFGYGLRTMKITVNDVGGIIW